MKTLNFFLSLGIVLLLGLFSGYAGARDLTDIREIDAPEAAKLLESGNINVLDVRTPSEFREGHLPGAKNLDFFGGNFDVEAASLPKDEPFLVYCRSGKRSAGAVEELKRAGIKHIFHLQNGMLGWEKVKLPVEK